MKKVTSIMLCFLMIFSLSACGNKKSKDKYQSIPGLDTTKEVTLKIAIPYVTNKALNTISNSFMNKYPNVSIQLQYVEDYEKNAVALFKKNSIDMILQKDIFYNVYTITNEETGEKVPDGTTTADYFYDFATDTEIDFSNTTDDISGNYCHTRTDDAGNEITYQYCYPLGGETRGVFVNKTLLTKYGLSVPKNYSELLNCCETLKQHGLIPIQGGGDTAAYGLGIAPAMNKIVHNESAFASMKAAECGVSAQFEDTLNKLYTLATK